MSSRISLTRQGWTLAAGSVVLFFIGRILGALELMLLGTAVVVLLLLSVLRTLSANMRLSASRVVSPDRIFQGAACRVDLTITNATRRRTPPLKVTDSMEASHPITFGVPLVRPRTSLTIPYQLSTHKRGRISIGPLHVIALDPFVLTQASRTLEVFNEVVVYPSIERLAALPVSTADRIEMARSGQASTATTGEEFHSLRPFVMGDEMRRVHWPSTARFDELHIRQSDTPSLELLTLLLDLRPDSQSEACLDRAVSFAASIFAAAEDRGVPVRLVATDGTDTGFVADRLSHAAILDYLATVEVGRNANLASTLNTVSAHSAGGSLLVVTSYIQSHDTTRIQAMAHRFSSLTYIIAVDPERPNAVGQEPSQHNKIYGGTAVLVAPGANFSDTWAKTMLRARRHRRVRR